MATKDTTLSLITTSSTNRTDRFVLIVQYLVRQSGLDFFVSDLERLIAQFAIVLIRWSDEWVGKRGKCGRIIKGHLLYSKHEQIIEQQRYDIMSINPRSKSLKHEYCTVLSDYIFRMDEGSDVQSFQLKLFGLNHYFNVGFLEFDLTENQPILTNNNTLNDYIALSGIHFNVFPTDDHFKFQNSPKLTQLGTPIVPSDSYRMNKQWEFTFTVDCERECIVVSVGETGEIAVRAWSGIRCDAIVFAVSCGNKSELIGIRSCDTPDSHRR